MCIPHAPASSRSSNYERREKKSRKEYKAFDKSLLKPDPNFVDERTKPLKISVKKEEKKGFFSAFFS